MSMVEANVTKLAQIMSVRRERVYKAERGGRIERKPNGNFMWNKPRKTGQRIHIPVEVVIVGLSVTETENRP